MGSGLWVSGYGFRATVEGDKMKTSKQISGLVTVAAALLGSAGPLFAAPQLTLGLPLGRTAYQTNETIEVTLVRTDKEGLPASDLEFNIKGQNGSRISCRIPLRQVPIEGQEARSTEHLRINGWLLLPGKYTLDANAYGVTTGTDID